jgi:flagellar hook-associated protein 1 FlgK
MAGDILSIGKTGLFAAQAGLATTGNNITNANVTGYSRQTVVQATALSIQSGYGFSGTGTQIAEIKRYSDSFLNKQVQTATASKSALDAFSAQVSQVDNLLSDTSAGLSPALQNFFAAVQDMTGNHASDSSRQGMFSAADTLAARFQSIGDRLHEIGAGVDNQIRSNVTLINSYADQIAQLNDQIGAFAGDATRQPNDLLDKRDQLVLKLNEQVKASVTPGDNNSYTISIGNGMPLVVGKTTYKLTATTSPTDQSRIAIGYQTANQVAILSENQLTGGELGGLLDFRANSLDKAQNSFGRIAAGLAMTLNEQNKLGMDQLGQQGKDVFSVGQPFIGKNVNNNASSTMSVSIAIKDPRQLTDSEYKVEYDGADYWIIRQSDKNPTKVTGVPQTVDGIDFSVTGTASANDNYLVRPTAYAANGFKLALTSPSQIAAAIPIKTAAPIDNKGSGSITAGTVDASYFASPLSAPVTLTYDSATGQLNGFPSSQAVTVTAGGVTTSYAAGAVVPFTSGASYSVGGMSFTISGVPQNGDSFTISKNTGLGDTRNAGLMAALQSTNILNNGNTTYQGAYASLVSEVGNKAREVQVNAEASGALLSQVKNAAQDVSGVNLDEEATNLLKYQQAYQAAGKIMQVASTVFDTLLSIGH